MTPRSSPFAVLGVSPTLEPAVIKRAWFSALARYPPHVDPEGFRTIRAAYEALTAPGGLAAAYLQAPPDIAAELDRYRARYDPTLSLLAAEQARSSATAAAAQRAMEHLARQTLAEAIQGTRR